MPEATAIREASRLTPHYLRPTTVTPQMDDGQKIEDRSECSTDSSFIRRPPSLRTARLLFIDDASALTEEQWRQTFPAPAHRIQFASTGVVGLERIRADSPDVIVLALDLPGQSGLDVYQRIRRINARIPVIFVTRSKRAEVAIEAMKLGAFNCLFEPFDLILGARCRPEHT